MDEIAKLGLFPKNSTADLFSPSLLSFIMRENRAVLSGSLLLLTLFSWLALNPAVFKTAVFLTEEICVCH